MFIQKMFHTERDVTYTLIYFPRQQNSKVIPKVMSFLFRLNDFVQLQFKICEGFSIMYSGMLLSHRQNLLDDRLQILNASAYGNQRIFACVRNSLKVIMKVSEYK